MVGKVKYYKNREQCALDFTEISEEKGGRGVCFTCSFVQLTTWAMWLQGLLCDAAEQHR